MPMISKLRLINGYEIYFLNGIAFNKELWTNVVSKKLNFKDCMAIPNIDRRMMALKYLDADKLLKGADAELIDHSTKNNRLYLIKKIFSEDAYFLRYECPSTGRIYLSGVNPKIASETKDADNCMAWKHNMDKEQYLALKYQT